MAWNYRIIDHGTHIALHEVHYRDDGSPRAYTTGPATFIADEDDGAIEIGKGLQMAIEGCRKPVLRLSDFGPGIG